MTVHASDDVRADLVAGRPVRFPRPPIGETADEAAHRTIPAAWIEELLLNPDRICTVPIIIENAIIEGSGASPAINKPYSEFRYSVDFKSCDFHCSVTIPLSIFKRRCSFTDCHFRNDLNLAGVSVPFWLFLTGAVVEGKLTLTDATIGVGLAGSGGEFRDSNFERLRARVMHFRLRRVGDRLRPTTFHGSARFLDCAIEAGVDLDACQFSGDADFTRMHVGANLTVQTPVFDDDLLPIEGERPSPLFEKSAVFRQMTVAGSAFFGGVNFHEDVDFESVSIGSNLLFTTYRRESRVRSNVFGGNFWMRRASIAGSVAFDDVHFSGKVDFRFSQIGGSCFFNGTASPLFVKELVLRFVHVGGNLELQGGTFSEAVDLIGLHVEGDFMIWRSRDQTFVKFGKRIECGGMIIDGSLEWVSPQIEGDVNLGNIFVSKTLSFLPTDDSAAKISGFARFNGAHIGSELNVRKAKFENGVNFYGITCGLVILSEAKIANWLGFLDARISTLRLAEMDDNGELERFAELPPVVDLRGTRFERLIADVITLSHRQKPYDRSVFEVMELYLRRAGDDRQAGDVYYLRKRRESKLLRKRAFAAQKGRTFGDRMTAMPGVLADFIAWSVYRYGVRPLRLLGVSVLLVILGAFVFARSGSVELKKPLESVKQEKRFDLGTVRALGYSLRLFIPIVELPIGDDLRPSTKPLITSMPAMTFEGYAFLHRLAGAILVPLGVAAIAGILVRKPK